MELLLIGIFSTAALVFIAYPLIDTRKHVHYMDDLLGSHEEQKLSYLHSKKKLVNDNIEDLEFEHEMGKLSRSDFERLRDGLLVESDRVTKDIDKTRVRRDIEELIEQEVRSRRKTK